MADSTFGGYIAADYELLGGTVDGMDVEDLSREELVEFMDARMAARNAAVNLILGELSLPTRARGSLLDQAAAISDWPKGTELSRGYRQKTSGLDAVGFPVYKFGPMRSGWSRDYLKKASNFEILRTFDNIMAAHLNTNWKEAFRALFQDTEVTWSHDMFPEDGSLKVKTLLNNDGYTSPEWMQNTFDGTENHYVDLGAGTLDEPDLEQLAALLRDHGFGVSPASGGRGGRIEHWINSAEQADVEAHTNFVAANDQIVIDINKEYAAGIDQDIYIGYNKASRGFIRVVDYVPADYCLTFVTNSQPNAGQQRARVNGFAPLRRRVPTTSSMVGIQRIDETQYPLVEAFWEDWFGFGVGERRTAAVGHLSGAGYSVPTIS